MRVALIHVPFGFISSPNLALSTFKAQFAAAGIQSDVIYASIEFANRVRVSAYRRAGAYADWAMFRTGWKEENPQLDFILATQSADHDNLRTWLTKYRMRDEYETYLHEFCDRDWSQYDAFALTASSRQVPAIFAFGRLLKEKYPNKPILYGGPLVFREIGLEYMKLPWVDFICLSEGEDVALPLIQALSKGVPLHDAAAELPAVAYRLPTGEVRSTDLRPCQADLDAAPIPDFEDYFSAIADCPGDPALPIQFSRGCPWGAKNCCNFCVESNLSGGVFIKQSSEVSVEYLRKIGERYPRQYLYFLVDCMLDGRMIREIMPRWAAIRPEWFNLFVEIKASVTRDEVRMLNNGGVTLVQVGIESLHPEGAALLGKPHRLYHAISCLKWLKHYNINVLWNYLLQIPGEHPDWYPIQLRMCENLCHLPPPHKPSAVIVTTFSKYLEDPARWDLQVYASSPTPTFLDPMRASWSFDYAKNHEQRQCLVESRALTTYILKEWMAQIADEPGFYDELYPAVPRPALKPRRQLVFNDQGVFDSRFTYPGRTIVLSDTQRSALIDCDGPVAESRMADRFGEPLLRGLEEQRLLYLGDRHCVSYVESLPDA